MQGKPPPFSKHMGEYRMVDPYKRAAARVYAAVGPHSFAHLKLERLGTLLADSDASTPYVTRSSAQHILQMLNDDEIKVARYGWSWNTNQAYERFSVNVVREDSTFRITFFFAGHGFGSTLVDTLMY
jgi:hypothetical protein